MRIAVSRREVFGRVDRGISALAPPCLTVRRFSLQASLLVSVSSFTVYKAIPGSILKDLIKISETPRGRATGHLKIKN